MGFWAYLDEIGLKNRANEAERISAIPISIAGACQRASCLPPQHRSDRPLARDRIPDLKQTPQHAVEPSRMSRWARRLNALAPPAARPVAQQCGAEQPRDLTMRDARIEPRGLAQQPVAFIEHEQRLRRASTATIIQRHGIRESGMANRRGHGDSNLAPGSSRFNTRNAARSISSSVRPSQSNAQTDSSRAPCRARLDAQRLLGDGAREGARDATSGTMSFARACDEYFASFKATLAPKQQKSWRTSMDAYVIPLIGDMPARDVTTEHGRGGLKHLLPPPRERSEVEALALQFSILCNVRTGDIVGQKGDDSKPRLWTIPNSKNGKPLRVPLSGAAISILKKVRAHLHDSLVFALSNKNAMLNLIGAMARKLKPVRHHASMAFDKVPSFMRELRAGTILDQAAWDRLGSGGRSMTVSALSIFAIRPARSAASPALNSVRNSEISSPNAAPVAAI
jgi:hypothetical protein